MHNLPPNFVVEIDPGQDRKVVSGHKERQRCDANWEQAKPKGNRIEVVNLNPVDGTELEVALNQIARERLGRS